MEGQGFNLTLYKNGKKLCTVDDSAYGGDYDFSDWDVVKEMNEELKQSMGKIKCVDFDIELYEYIFVLFDIIKLTISLNVFESLKLLFAIQSLNMIVY